MAHDDLGCLPSAGTLRRIRWPLQPRSRDRVVPCGQATQPLDGALTPPWAACRCSSVFSGEPDNPTSLRPTRAPTLSRRRSLRARPLFTRPCPLFLERVCRAYSGPDVAYRLLQHALRRAGTNPSSRSSQGRRPRPPSVSYGARCLPCGSGDPRRAALRPSVPIPVPVPPAYAGLPDRDIESTAPPSLAYASEVEWRLTCTGLWTE